MNYQKYAILLAGASLLLNSVVYAAPEGASLSALVQEAEQQGALPGPILELMLKDGGDLENVTKVTVSTASSSSYAQGFTNNAICMSGSMEQAQRVHDIAIDSVVDEFKTVVEAEARYTLSQFKENGCEETEELGKEEEETEEDDTATAGVEENSEVSDELPLDESTTEARVVDVDQNTSEVESSEVEEDQAELEDEVLVISFEPIPVDSITGTVAGGASSSL